MPWWGNTGGFEEISHVRDTGLITADARSNPVEARNRAWLVVRNIIWRDGGLFLSVNMFRDRINWHHYSNISRGSWIKSIYVKSWVLKEASKSSPTNAPFYTRSHRVNRVETLFTLLWNCPMRACDGRMVSVRIFLNLRLNLVNY